MSGNGYTIQYNALEDGAVGPIVGEYTLNAPQSFVCVCMIEFALLM